MDHGRDHRDGGAYPQERMIKIPGRRPVTDYSSTMIRYMRHRRPLYRGGVFMEKERPSASYIIDMVPPIARPTNAVDSIPCKFLHTSSNKEKHAINIVKWTPEGRRCLTCSASGEFTLWNGTAFNFETLMQAHDHSIRAATYSHDGDWLVSGDMNGVIRYHNRDFNRVNDFQAHGDCIRDIAFSPNDSKFVTASDDATLKIFDFSAAVEDSSITGHSWEAKTVDWHPTKGLLVSGSKDHQVKLWDPRSGRCLTTLHGHKNTIVKTAFSPHGGNLLATCARDNVARILDLRMMRDVALLRGHTKEITTFTWHPIHASMISTASHDGAILHYLLDEPHTPPGTAPSIPVYDSPDPSIAPAQTIYPAHRVDNAHAMAVWSLAWHPVGHILASGGNDRCTRFWTRARPGEGDEVLKDAFHLGEQAAEAQGTWSKARASARDREMEERELMDEAEGLVDQTMPSRAQAGGITLPGLPGLGEGGPPGLGGINGMNGGRDYSVSPPPPSNPMLAMLQAQGVLPPPIPDMAAGMPGMPPPLAGMPGIRAGGASTPFPPGIDAEKFMELVREGKLPPPPLGFTFPGAVPPPPPPGFQMAPGGFGGAPPPLGMPPMVGIPGLDASGANGVVRRRGPLPSQQEGFEQEKRKGNFRTAR